VRFVPAESRHRWLILAAMTGTLAMMMLDATVVSVALPSIQRELDLTQTELQWVVNAYLLALAALVAVGGRLADMFNRVAVLIVGISLFALASAACGLADDELAILLARAVQGAGAALMIPPTGAIVINTFPPEERGKAMGVYAGVSMLALSLGPLVGGLFTEYADWRWVFWVNLPVAAATIAMVLWTRPPGQVERGQRLDWAGLATLVPGLAAVVLALMQSNTWGWGSASVLVLLGGGLLLLVVFVLIERRQRSPLVELGLFASRNFRGDSLVLFCVQFSLIALTVFGAIYVQDMLGFSPVEAGLGLLPLTIPLLFAAPIGGRIYDRAGPRLLVSTGCLLTGAGLLWTAAVLHELAYGWLVPGYVALGVGVGLVMSPTNTDAMGAAPAPLRGQASGMIQTVRQVGGTVGLAIVGAIVAGVQHDRLQDFLLGIGAPQSEVDSVQRILAEDAGSQRQIAEQVPAAELRQVTEAAKDAAVDGIAAAYWVAGGVVVLAAVAAWAILRRQPVARPDGAAAAPAG
jgi:EmrB/QacA subfamily drug resistance transporter